MMGHFNHFLNPFISLPFGSSVNEWVLSVKNRCLRFLEMVHPDKPWYSNFNPFNYLKSVMSFKFKKNKSQ